MELQNRIFSSPSSHNSESVEISEIFHLGFNHCNSGHRYSNRNNNNNNKNL
jgi:hypothetical protein